MKYAEKNFLRKVLNFPSLRNRKNSFFYISKKAISTKSTTTTTTKKASEKLFVSTTYFSHKKPNSSFAYCLFILGAGVLLSESSEEDPMPHHEELDNFSVLLREYLTIHYPDEKLSKEIIEQLRWFQESMITTSESNVRLSDKKESVLHVEIKRALARLHCYRLLRKGGKPAYQKFIKHQPDEEKLDFKTFSALSHMLQVQPQAIQMAIEASCFITISEKAKDLAKQAGAPYTNDSEKFLTVVMQQCPNIFPIRNALDKSSQPILPLLYLQDTHARHMLYTEGGDNMFQSLRKKIKDKHISKSAYEAWWCRWLINIAGFRGHEQPEGSLYLTEPTATTLFLLKKELDKLWENPEYDVLSGYLEERAKQLGVSNLYLAHLGAMMRIYKPKEGREVQAWFESLSILQQKNYTDKYQEFRNKTQITPTYEPAIIDNLRALGCDIRETLSLHAAIISAATVAYHDAIVQQKIDASIPLCFGGIAFKPNLLAVLEIYRHSPEESLPICIDHQGEVAYEKPNTVFKPHPSISK